MRSQKIVFRLEKPSDIRPGGKGWDSDGVRLLVQSQASAGERGALTGFGWFEQRLSDEFTGTRAMRFQLPTYGRPLSPRKG
jgi:hypothetical protein